MDTRIKLEAVINWRRIQEVISLNFPDRMLYSQKRIRTGTGKNRRHLNVLFGRNDNRHFSLLIHGGPANGRQLQFMITAASITELATYLAAVGQVIAAVVDGWQPSEEFYQAVVSLGNGEESEFGPVKLSRQLLHNFPVIYVTVRKEVTL